MFPIKTTRSVSLMPNTMTVGIKYSEVQSDTHIGAGATGTNYAQFRLNGCHDPHVSIGGHQPWGWDDLKPFYNDYRVRAAEVYVEWKHQAGDDVWMIWAVGDSSVAPYAGLTINSCKENPRIGLMKLTGAINAKGHDKKSVRIKVDIRKQFKRFLSDAEDQWNNAWTATSADPSSQIFLWLGYLRGPESAAVNPTVHTSATIKYLVDYRRPVMTVPS